MLPSLDELTKSIGLARPSGFTAISSSFVLALPLFTSGDRLTTPLRELSGIPYASSISEDIPSARK